MTQAQERAIRDALTALGDALVAALAEPAEDDGMERLLDVKTTARLMSIGRSALYEAMARGQVRSVKVGKRRLVPSGEIARLAAGAHGN